MNDATDNDCSRIYDIGRTADERHAGDARSVTG
jgi:hypothetical protein